MNAVPGAARRRRTAGFGAIAVAAVLLTSSCAAGRVAQTIRQRPSINGVNAQVGSVNVRNVSVEAPTEGTSYPKGSALRLTGVFVNNGQSTDALTGISSSAITGWGVYPSVTDGDQVVAAASASAAGATAPTSPAASPSGSATASSAPKASQAVPIPAHSRISYGVPDATGALLVLNTRTKIYPGSVLRMNLTFARAGTVTVEVPVQITTDPEQATVPAPSGSDEGN